MEILTVDNTTKVMATYIMNTIRSIATMTISHRVVVAFNFGKYKIFDTTGVVRNLVNTNGGWLLIVSRLWTVMKIDEINASVDIKSINFKYPSTEKNNIHLIYY